MVILDAYLASRSYLKIFPQAQYSYFVSFLCGLWYLIIPHIQCENHNKQMRKWYLITNIYTSVFCTVDTESFITYLVICFIVASVTLILSLCKNILWILSCFSWDVNSKERGYFYTSVLCVTNYRGYMGSSCFTE